MRTVSLGRWTLLLWPLVSSVVGLVAAALVAWQQHRANEALVQERLQTLAWRTADQVLRRLRVYEYGLRGLRSAVIVAGNQVEELSGEHFRRFSASQDIPRQYPGVTALSFARRVPLGQEAPFLAGMRDHGWPDLQIRHIEPHAGDHFVIQYIEPIEGNASALGYDIMSEPKRREAAEAAIRSGELRITAPITLIQKTTQAHRSVVLYMPVYRSITTPEPQRRSAEAFGIVSAPLTLDDMLHDLESEDDAYALALLDITQPAAPERFYATPSWQADASARVQHIVLPVYGRRWQLELQARPGFMQRLNLRSPAAAATPVAATGLLLGLLLGAGLRARQREQVIASERAQTAAVVDSSHDAIIRHTPDDHVQTWNAAAERLLGWRQAEVLGRSLLDLAVPPERREEAQQVLARVQRGEDVPPFDTVRLDRDGHPVAVSLSVSPIRGSGGRITGAATTMRDIRERQAARARIEQANASLEAALQQVRQSEARARHTAALLEQLLETAPDPIWTKDTQGRWVVVNPAAAAVIGRPREALVGLRDRDVLPAAYAAGVEAEDRCILAEGQTVRTEETLFDASRGDERVFFSIRVPLRSLDGHIMGLVGIAHDITERKEAERRLAELNATLEQRVQKRTAELATARDAAEAANRAKSEFLANMSHEIRTPMNAIIGQVHLMRLAGATPEQERRLEQIDAAAQHLLSLINHILDLSKIDAGKLQLEQRDFALPALLSDVRSIIGEAAAAKGLDIIIEATGVPTWLRGDDTRVRQALLNYAANAVKFTDRGHITLRAVLAKEQGKELLLRFEVEDTGAGIDSAELARLFRPFEQVDASTTRRFGGTGLGLSITQGLARLMGGDAGARSTPGQGSTFWFTAWLLRGQERHLPTTAIAPKHATDLATQLRQCCRGTRVLLAEDNPVNREIALEMLRHAGLEVDVAGDGREALQLAQAQPYALILMDMQMPVMDGLAATCAIRTMPGLQSVPILAMTANAFDEDRRACTEAGMDDFISKPVTMEALYTKLLQWLRPLAPIAGSS
jgi:PAS domain S-box-containing protein